MTIEFAALAQRKYNFSRERGLLDEIVSRETYLFFERSQQVLGSS
jgi:hypothetical protein